MLAGALPGARVYDHEAVGIHSDAKEAMAFALLANDCVLGLPTNVPGATGGRPAVLGKVTW
jgi:anhydro-N-acetylmuramic acid kinase